MSAIKVGTGIVPVDPERSAALHWHDTLAAARQAEALGLDWFCMGDHPGFLRSVDWHTGLAALATATTKIRLWPTVIAVPWHAPSLLAQTMASLDVVSNGRLMLGLGTGWHGEEFEAYGVPFERKRLRLKRLIDTIHIMRTMWTQDRATFEGETWSIHNVACEPKPVQKPYPPIWIGSRGGHQIIREVIAPLADGWLIGAPSMRDGPPIEATIAAFREACESIGRDPGEVTICMNLVVDGRVHGVEESRMTMPGRPSRHMHIESYKLVRASEPERIVDRIASLSELGVTYFNLALRSDAVSEDLAAVARGVLERLK